MSRKKRDNTRWLSTALTAIIVISVFTVGTVPVSARVASVIRDLPEGPVGTDEEIVVSLTQTGFFLGEGCVKETLPDDFTYVDESLTGNAHMGVDYTEENELIYTEENELIISFDGETTVTYSVRTSSYAQIAEFEGRYFTISELGEERGPVDGKYILEVEEGAVSVSGKVIYTCNTTGIVGATVNLTQGGSLKNSTVTNGNGEYTFFTGVTAGDYDIDVSKTGFWDNSTSVSVSTGATTTVDDITLWIRGDLNGNCAVDIGDVSKVANMVVGNVPKDPKADFNGNGDVDISDAAKIANYFVGNIGEL